MSDTITLPREQLEKALPCGHHASLAVVSAESGQTLYCELCDDKAGRRDAELREQELQAELAALRARLAQTEQRPKPVAWRPIETAPKDNKRPLYLARFVDGELVEIDFDGAWKFWQESWEMPHVQGWDWVSARGIEEPTHWAYQDEPPPPQPEQSPEPVAWMYQHDETGRMTFCENDGVNTRETFEKLNPRYSFVCECHASPPPRQELSEEEMRYVERYKFLRGDVGPESVRWPRWKVEYWLGGYWSPLQGQELDAAIDRAIERKVRG